MRRHVAARAVYVRALNPTLLEEPAALSGAPKFFAVLDILCPLLPRMLPVLPARRTQVGPPTAFAHPAAPFRCLWRRLGRVRRDTRRCHAAFHTDIHGNCFVTLELQYLSSL